MPVGRSPELRRALQLTEQRLGDEVRFEDLAAEVGLAPRSLARRFSDETGMTWRAALANSDETEFGAFGLFTARTSGVLEVVGPALLAAFRIGRTWQCGQGRIHL